MDGLTVRVKASALVFVVSSMLAMGLSLTIQQIIEPLKNVRMVLVALVVNFVAVPLLVSHLGPEESGPVEGVCGG